MVRVQRYDPAADLARRHLYQYIALATLCPSDSRRQEFGDRQFRRIVTAAAKLARDERAFHPAALSPGEIPPSEIDPSALFSPGADPDAEHLDAFGLTVGKDCPPYETEYCTNRETAYRSQQMADIAGFYRAFGQTPSADHPERVDHLSLEAEFLHSLIGLEIYARQTLRDADRADLCRKAQRDFFAAHLGWWLAAFGIRVQRRMRDGFFADFGAFLRSFVPFERAALGLPPFTELPAVRSVEEPAEGDCFACGLLERAP
jgi:TorA maturation chaperone TorD